MEINFCLWLKARATLFCWLQMVQAIAQVLILFTLLFFLRCLHIHYNLDRCLVQLSSGAKTSWKAKNIPSRGYPISHLRYYHCAAEHCSLPLCTTESLGLPRAQTVYQRSDCLSFSGKSLLLPIVAPTLSYTVDASQLSAIKPCWRDMVHKGALSNLRADCTFLHVN